MGFFSFKKKKEEEFFPVDIKALALHRQLDREVAILVKDDGQPLDHRIRVCLTQETLTEQLEILNCQFQVYALGIVLDYLLQNDEVTELALYGLPLGSILIKKTELLAYSEMIENFCILYAQARGRMTIEKAYSLLKNKTFFYLGEPFVPTKGKEFGFATLDYEGQTAVKLFLSPESAQDYNDQNLPVTPILLRDLKAFTEGTFALIIEPHRNYWILF